MFRGATKVTLDAKGRLAIPTGYRERIAARCDGQLIVTVDKDYCLLIYPFPDWEEIERKLMRLPSLNKRSRRLQRLMGRVPLMSRRGDYFLIRIREKVVNSLIYSS